MTVTETETGMRVVARVEWSLVRAGEVALCGYPVMCSACLQHGVKTVYVARTVVLANITAVEGGWHGWWSCPYHWERSDIRRRLERTGSVTP